MVLLVVVVLFEFLFVINGEGNSLFYIFINIIECVVEVVSFFGNSCIFIFSILIGVLFVYICEFGGVVVIVNLLMNKGVVKSKC